MPIKCKITDSIGKEWTGEISYGGVNSHDIVPHGYSETFLERLNATLPSTNLYMGMNAINQYVSDTKRDILDILESRITPLWEIEEMVDNRYAYIGAEYGALINAVGTYQYYGFGLNTDGLITGFNITAFNPATGNMEQKAFSTFDINADNFRVFRSIRPDEVDTYGTGIAGMRDPITGDLLPAFAIHWDDTTQEYYIQFNGRVVVGSLPASVSNYLGEFADFDAVNQHILDIGIALQPGYTFKNLTDNAVYMWDGDEWISTGYEVKFKSTVFYRGGSVSSPPATPSGGDYANGVPTTEGWTDGIPTGEGVIWMSVATFSNRVDYTLTPAEWSAPIIAVDTPDVDFEWSSSDVVDPGTPTTPLNSAVWGNTSDDTTIWMAIRKKAGGDWSGWEVSKVKGEKGETGAIGAGTNVVFKRSATKPTTPPPSEGIPAGWSDDVPTGTALLWQSTGTRPEGSLILEWKEPIAIEAEAVAEIVIFRLNSTSINAADEGSYNFSTNTLSAPSGWSTSVPSVGSNNDTVYSRTALYTGSKATTVAKAVWSGATIYSKRVDGLPGSAGATGSRGSAILTGSATASGTMVNAFISAFGNVVTKDQYISTTPTTGTQIYTYNGSSFTNTTVLTIHGDTVVNGTIAAEKLAATAIYGKTISITSSTSASGGSGGLGGSLGWFTTSRDKVAVYGYNTTTNGAGIAGEGTGTGGYGGYFISHNGNAVVADTYRSDQQWGFITYDKCYAGAGFSPFTGSHIVYSSGNLEAGQLVHTGDSWVVDVNQTLIHVDKCTSARDKRVLGVVSYVKTTLLDNISNNPIVIDEYRTYIEHMIDNNFAEITVNSLGEGGILVCSENGNIENGDYICSSNVPGKGMRQDDDLLHNYTVAKALESVIWENEVVGSNGVYEVDGYKVKMIACTYHCG